MSHEDKRKVCFLKKQSPRPTWLFFTSTSGFPSFEDRGAWWATVHGVSIQLVRELWVALESLQGKESSSRLGSRT